MIEILRPNLMIIPANATASRHLPVQTGNTASAAAIVPLGLPAPRGLWVREDLPVHRVFPVSEALLVREDLKGSPDRLVLRVPWVKQDPWVLRGLPGSPDLPVLKGLPVWPDL